jgi:hypothetical protein
MSQNNLYAVPPTSPLYSATIDTIVTLKSTLRPELQSWVSLDFPEYENGTIQKNVTGKTNDELYKKIRNK